MSGKQIGLLVALLLAAAPLVRPAALAQNEKTPAAPNSVAQDSVYAAFAAYRSAILASEPEAAFQRVDSATVGYYARVLDLALYAEAQGLSEEELAAQLLEQMSGTPVGKQVWQSVGRP